MSYQLTIVEKPTYVHAVVTGPNTMENVMRYLQELQGECQSRQTFNVLIEENLTGRRLETWDVYQIAAEGSTRTRGLFQSVAYVDVNAGGDLMKFAETVSNNRGVPMSVFATVAEVFPSNVIAIEVRASGVRRNINSPPGSSPGLCRPEVSVLLAS